jgi:hypothetical protein
MLDKCSSSGYVPSPILLEIYKDVLLASSSGMLVLLFCSILVRVRTQSNDGLIEIVWSCFLLFNFKDYLILFIYSHVHTLFGPFLLLPLFLPPPLLPGRNCSALRITLRRFSVCYSTQHRSSIEALSLGYSFLGRLLVKQSILFLIIVLLKLFCFFILCAGWGVHCGICKSSYSISNISYFNSPPPPFSFIPSFPPSLE